jgi:hypothetical protein
MRQGSRQKNRSVPIFRSVLIFFVAIFCTIQACWRSTTVSSMSA